MPTSIRCTPTSSRASAMRMRSSSLNATPVTAHRRERDVVDVDQCSLIRAGYASGAKFIGETHHA